MSRTQAVSPAALPAIGQPFAGGFYAGRLFFDGVEHALIDAGREFEQPAQWWDRSGPRLNVRGSKSYHDGLANTRAMAEAGSAIAQNVLAMSIRDHRGWHIPAIEELQVMRANLLQLEPWGKHWPADGAGGPAQAFALREYWSSTQKSSAGSAWCLHMLPWCTPDTNWTSKEKAVRPVRTLPIKADAFVHEPSSDAPLTEADLRGLANAEAVASVIERFVNEDAGKFYGRTDALVEELAAIAGGRQ
ncbi:DUF1566 domain-containing protein [Pseudomonas fitomaticsae]|uniref:Uncharacterized protein n=1 Tax=Pseudomonas fitomaticsae TaxID=2837969 RepID=A0ABY3PXA9_9PSED|nr:DUF1566 domain-containing protein [Pseudomonas fitomaticsae]UFP98584.1 hypothetical protein KJY40_21430 [Pseudomonas fitomaticsae]